MQYLLSALLSFSPSQLQEAPGVTWLRDAYSWSGLTVGVTTRDAVLKRFGPVLVVTTTGHAIYDEDAIRRGGQSDDLPAKEIALGFSGGVLISMRITPKDRQPDLWWQRRFGEPSILVRDKETKAKTILIWHDQHVVATVDPDGSITTLWVTIQEPMMANQKPPKVQ